MQSTRRADSSTRRGTPHARVAACVCPAKTPSRVHTPQLGPPKRTPEDRFDLPSKSRFTSNTWQRSGR